jgi:hypothetical protein
MAPQDKETSFPKIPEGNWWKLRSQFQRTVPPVVTPEIIAAKLSMTPASARANIFTPMKRIGLFDDEGKPTSLAYDWRSDAKYGEACKTIREAVYPPEVLEAYGDKDGDFSGLTEWFMHYCGCGQEAAKRYAAFYRLVLNADPSAQSSSITPSARGRQKPEANNGRPSRAKSTIKSNVKNIDSVPDIAQPNGPQQVASTPSDPALAHHGMISPPRTVSDVQLPTQAPSLCIDIQIHISADAQPAQIEQIFASMAKHLYGRG